MKDNEQLRFKTIGEYHRYMGLPGPQHPLISLVLYDRIQRPHSDGPVSFIFDFYCISLKRNTEARMRYGQQEYDFDSGVLFFMAPGQVFSVSGSSSRPTGWMLLLHPDFLWGTPLAKTIQQYEYFSYEVNEALHLSEKEEATIVGLMQDMEGEYHASIDQFSQSIIVAQIELLLTYAERFYRRQFITRKKASHQLLSRFETLLALHFSDDELAAKGQPSVQAVAGELHVSQGYLSGLLKTLTGQTTQQLIHEKLIEKAKQLLSTTRLSVSEIAYALGFEHSQSFNKLFKAKTDLSPLAFRQSFQQN